jgi:hypothetical protein
VTGLVYAPAALRAAERGSPELWSLHRAALLRGQTPLVVAPVLAAAGTPGARTEALLAGCALVDFPVSAARDVGRLLHLVPGTDLVTAAAALAALAARAVVVTDEAQPFQAIGARLGVALAIAPLTGAIG